MAYADAALEAGARLEFPVGHDERAVYVVEGEIAIAGETFGAGQLLVLREGDAVTMEAAAGARLLLFGGERMDGPRHVWWNFVSSSKERIEQAKDDWRERRFPPVPEETEFIPLPEQPTQVRYP
jgi:redox-sensitive bicupin YhaK (pirin superfamily)